MPEHNHHYQGPVCCYCYSAAALCTWVVGLWVVGLGVVGLGVGVLSRARLAVPPVLGPLWAEALCVNVAYL